MKLVLLCFVIILQFANCSSQINERENILHALSINEREFNNANQVAQMDLLRKTLASYANRGFTPQKKLFVQEVIPTWDHLTPSKRIMAMKENTYHITCGKISYLLRDIYASLGWLSTTYNFGRAGTNLTHEVTLVSSNEKVLLQDAYYNYGLRDQDQPMDFFEFLKRMKAGSDQNYFDADTITVQLIIETNSLSMDTVNCKPKYIGKKIWGNDSIASYSFLVDLPINLYDSCYGLMNKTGIKLDSLVRFEQLFLSRVSTMDGAKSWQKQVDQILNP